MVDQSQNFPQTSAFKPFKFCPPDQKPQPEPQKQFQKVPQQNSAFSQIVKNQQPTFTFTPCAKNNGNNNTSGSLGSTTFVAPLSFRHHKPTIFQPVTTEKPQSVAQRRSQTCQSKLLRLQEHDSVLMDAATNLSESKQLSNDEDTNSVYNTSTH